MANYAVLKAAINAVIKTNGNKEITGQVLNQTLMAIVDSLGENYQFAGVAVPSTNPGTPDQNIFYLATQAGTYTNFGATVLPAGISMLEWKNNTWSIETFFTIDDAPTAGSDHLVKSGGVKTAIDNVAFSTNEKVKDVGIDSTPTSGSDNLIKSGAVFDAFKNDGGAYDVSVHFPTGGVEGGNTYTLDGAIAMVPQNMKKGGMSIKFVSSSDNKYVQFRYMSSSTAAADFTNVANWQGVDDEPTAGSKNLVKSDGVAPLNIFKDILASSCLFSSYLYAENSIINTNGNITTLNGYDLYRIPINTLDVIHLSWSENFHEGVGAANVFIAEFDNNQYVRFNNFENYGAFATSANECIILGILNVKALWILVKHGYDNVVNISFNQVNTKLKNDTPASIELNTRNTIFTSYFFGNGTFSKFNSPYNALFVKMNAGDSIAINKSFPGVTSKGAVVISNGTKTALSSSEYTAAQDCVVCIYNNTEVTGTFLYTPVDSIKIAAQNVIGGVNESSHFQGLTGVAFGTSLTVRSLTTDGYLSILEGLSGITFDNQGIGGGKLDGNILTAIKQYSSYSGKNVCIIEGFVNDWYGSMPLGNYTDTGETTVCGCLRSAINYIRTQNSNLTLIVILDHYGQDVGGTYNGSTAKNSDNLTQYEYYNELEKVANSLGIPVIPQYKTSEMGEHTPQYFIDNIHLTALGAQQSGYSIWSKMALLYPNK